MIAKPPPRQIPLVNTIRSLFGGIRYQASWFFLGVFSVFFLGLAFDLSSFLLSRLNTEVVPGVLLEKQQTWLTDTVVGTGGMLHRQGEPFYRYIYRYTVGGSAYLGDSYAGSNHLDVGETVEVEHLEAFPGISRIRGMASEPHLSGGKAPLIIILVMILIASASTIAITRRRLRLYRLMKNGVATKAVAKESQLLSRTYHGREWYQMLWEFNANGRRHTLTQRPYYTERVTMGELRTVLYDVKNPNKAVLLDRNTPLMDGSARTPAANAFSAARLLFVPIVSTLAILASIYLEIVY
jgi:hypothetical protein